MEPISEMRMRKRRIRENPENPSDEPSGETINQAVEGEKEDNPLSAVETITVESKV